MGPLIITVILVCGFWYTENHYPSRIHHARTNGWTSYFYVAMHGCRFIVLGFLLAVALSFTVWILGSVICNIVNLFSKEPYDWGFGSWFMNEKVMELPLLAVASLCLSCLIAYAQGDAEKKKMEDEDERQSAYRIMAASDSIESLLVQAIDEKMLIFVTLKSRKVYVGYVVAPRIELHNTRHLEIIPFISGYRDKNTLRFVEQHRYSDLYLSRGIDLESKPLNLQHFRHVFPMDQIEAISLFDAETYKHFDEFSEPIPDKKTEKKTEDQNE
ncbi:hypothetical protein Z042_01505 [Chania multitudinisentens RB-25]|uniref:Uncharacterized protein n=1 Tax=Chania multitudinisentens RB-25 TaxID=1441930 RepID=W0L3Y1_9GAMM|nr:hypothetical protein [Chania multitudinisentens]AHG18458.1 hypothetical protein Z042_01505 [Chania multitudinisentens RB-25]